MPDRPALPESISGSVLAGTLREGPAVLVVRGKDSLGLPLDFHLFQGNLVEPRLPKAVFFDQVRASAALHHERLAAVVNAGEKGGWWFVACKGNEGATMADLLRRGHLDEERALGIFAGVAEGLAVLEAAGLRHGGLEPGAISLPGAGQVLLGLRRLVPVDLAARDARYMAPEEARGEDGGIASDMFSLGLLLAEALHGRPVVEGTPAEARVRLARGDVPPPASFLRGVMPGTVELASSMLSPDPRHRPPTAADAARVLRSLQAAFTATESLEGSSLAPIAALPVAAPPAAPAYAAPPAAPFIPAAPVARPAPPQAASLPAAPPVLAPAAYPAAPAAAPAAAPPAGLRSRRAHARLVIPFRGVEQIHEVLDSITWIGPAEDGRTVARNREFPGALARIEVGPQADVLVATGSGPRPVLRGQEVAQAELRFGDEIGIGDGTLLFEKSGRLLPEGAEGAEEGRSHRLREKPSRAPFVVGGILCAVVLGWGVLRIASARGHRSGESAEARTRLADFEKRFSALPAPPAAVSVVDRASREEAAFRLLDSSREEALAGRPSLAREKLDTLIRTYPDSGAALLAREDLQGLSGDLRNAGLDEFRSLEARAEGLAAEGKFGEAFELLRSFALSHRGTWVGDRAEASADATRTVAADRVDDLLRAARAAADRRDWQSALDAAGLAERTGFGDSRERAAKERERLRGLVPPTTPGGEGPAPAAGGPDGTPPKETRPVPKEPPRREPPKPAGRDEEAAELFRSSREALDAGRAGEAERGFHRLLAEFRDAKVVHDYGVEVLQRLADATKKGRGVAGLFHGALQFQERRVVLSYEFEDPAEAADWETVHMFAVPQKGTFKLDRGELAGEGAAAFMMRAAFKPESVSMSFRIRPGVPAQDMGAILAEPKDLANHLYFTIGNQFFNLGKGGGSYKEPGNLIVVFGKGMWSATDAGMVGFVRTAASAEPKVPSNKWTEVEVAKEKKTARFSLGGKTLNGASIGDNKYEITGARPALFVLLSEARFDEVTVTGELDPEWVKTERERVFPEIK